jgi:hypothetical protein
MTKSRSRNVPQERSKQELPTLISIRPKLKKGHAIAIRRKGCLI